MKNDFPADEILVARGKYSTLSSERRAIFKAMREDIEAVVNTCQRALRNTDDLDFALSEAGVARKRVEAVIERLTQATVLTHHMNELKPLAWGAKGAPE